MQQTFPPQARRTAQPSGIPTGGGPLRRKCACGRAADPAGTCAQCRRRRKPGDQGLTVQPKLLVDRPGDACEREADRVAARIAGMSECRTGGEVSPIGPGNETRKDVPSNGNSTVPPVVHEVLNSPGQPLDPATRAYMEPRFGHDFGQVRVHTSTTAAASARAVNAQAYTVGRDVVFAGREYGPGSSRGRRLLAHELAHVVQQDTGLGPRLQRFSAELEGDRVYVEPEKGDTDRDLDRVLCPQITNRKIAGRTKIDVTECFPPGTIKAMELGPLNCADFVRRAIGQTPPKGGISSEWLITRYLWKELLKKGLQVRSFGVVTKQGKVEPAEGVSWKQLNPRMGDFVFMMGRVLLYKGETEPNRKGDNFAVTWDHVGVFVVRSRRGFDYHLAKDGDENPTGLYHTGMKAEELPAPGAYVKGASTLLAYLGQLADEETASKDLYVPGTESEAYWNVPDEERQRINEETNRRFRDQTGATPRLDWNDPKDRPLARQWLRIRDQVMRQRHKGSQSGATP